MISVKHLDKYFNRRKKNEIHVLNDISLDFPGQGLVVLLGASGSGKTTLLNVIGGLDRVQSGQIAFDDITLDNYDAATWDKIRNEHVGYIFQNYNLLPELSVFDNIAFVLKMLGITDKDYIESRVNYVLKAVNMYPFRKKKALQLSGGQQQRVAIARALVKNPKVIIADEPTGNLDSKNTLEIMNIIKQISTEKLVILVTHEKEMASFYGNRIIEIKDGRITSDQFNDEIENHAIGRDDTIYLKDLVAYPGAKTELINLGIYSDGKTAIESAFNIKLIVKNQTLYLDIQSPYEKVKLVDPQSGVIIKNENYVKKTREELMKTTFDLGEIDHSKIRKDKTSMVSIKQTFRMAIEKILRTGRKGKLMLFSFLVAGMVLAFTISTLASVAIVRPESNMQISKGYVHLEASETMPSYSQLSTLKTSDPSVFINPYKQATMRFLNPNGSEAYVGFNAQIETIDMVNKYRLTAGRLPFEDYEFVITSKIADQLIETRSGQDFGIWSYAHLFQERFVYGSQTGRIVGIVESEIPLIFLSDIAMAYYHFRNERIEPYEMHGQSIIAYGMAPTDGQYLVSRDIYDQFIMVDPESITFPFVIPILDVTVSGIHNLETKGTMVMTLDTMKVRAVDGKEGVFVYSDSTDELITSIENSFGLKAVDVYQAAFDQRLSQQRVALISTLSTSLLLIGFSMVGFYFVIRSSLISRIYEVSVYRALGVKKTDIFRSFLVEIVTMTTISTLVGYVLATILLDKLQGGLLGRFNFFYVSPLSVVFGIIILYIINILAGIAPVFLLLKKTPAQILSQYDI